MYLNLRELLCGIAAKYNTALQDDAVELLRRADDVIAPHLPDEYKVRSRYGMGNRAAVPLIAIMDRFESSAQRGLYVAYHFSVDEQRISISLAQGVDAVADGLSSEQARTYLREEAKGMRRLLDGRDLVDLDQEIRLASRLERPRNYEASVICARTYPVSAVPDNQNLMTDLKRFVGLYGHVRASVKPAS